MNELKRIRNMESKKQIELVLLSYFLKSGSERFVVHKRIQKETLKVAPTLTSYCILFSIFVNFGRRFHSH